MWPAMIIRSCNASNTLSTSHQHLAILAQLRDFVVESYYPQIHASYAADASEMTVAWFREVAVRTARLVAKWQGVGFCHGVLNTDNMSIIGLTIDYGPYGMLS